MKKGTAMVLTLVVAFLLLAGCTSKSSNSPNASSPSANAPTQAASESPGGEAPKVSWDDKYDPPIEMDVVLPLPQASNAKNVDPKDTSYFKLAEEVLGIKLNIVWALPPDQYNQKFNLELATGNLPDVFSLPYGSESISVYKDLAESGAIHELGDKYDAYFHPDLLKYLKQPELAAYGSNISAVGGKSYAYMNTFDVRVNTPYWYVRKDYLDKVSLPVPTTIEELIAAAEAMSKAGLGSLGVAGGTDAAAFLRDVWGSFVPLFNSYGAYPDMWIEKGGKLENGIIQPEVKDGLLALQGMYKSGALDKGFASKTAANFTEDVLNGKIGIFSGVWWHAAWPLTTMFAESSDAEWIALPVLPSAKVAEPKTSSIPFSASHYNMVSANFAHPEALAKLLSLDYELQVNGVTRWGKELAVDKYENNWKPLWITASIFEQEHQASSDVAFAASKEEAMAVIERPENQGSANLNIALNGVYKYKWEGSQADWGWYFSRSPQDSGLGLVFDLYNNGKVQTEQYMGPPLAAQIEKGVALNTARNETFVRIIMGESVDTFDTFVENWKKHGGDQMTEEANAWYSTK